MNPHKTTQILRLALRSLLQRKMRSLLSVLGVVCGVMAVVAMIAIGQGARRETIAQIERLGTRNIYIKAVGLTETQHARARQSLSAGLTTADIDRLLNGCPMIARAASLRLLKAAIMGLPRELSPQAAACSADYLGLLNLVVAEGRSIVARDIDQKNLVCVLGSEVARLMGAAGETGRLLRIEDQLYKVVGILDRMEANSGRSAAVSSRNTNEMIFLPLSSARDLATADGARKQVSSATPAQEQELSEIVLQIDRSENVPTAAEMIRRIMQVAHRDTIDYQVIVPLELLRQAERTHRTFNLVLGAIAGISLLVGGIGIMNIMLATVSERIREIGIRRAVGATRRHIIVHFLTEAVLLTLTGGAIGLVCGLAAVWAIAWLAGWRVALSFWGLALPLLMSLAVGLFFGIYPARQASRVDPIVALRNG